MRQHFGLADALGLAGLGALIHGAGLIWTPLAWVVAGLGLLSIAVLLGRAEPPPGGEDPEVTR